MRIFEKPLVSIAVIAYCMSISASYANELEVLHEWTSESEVNALNVIKDHVAAKGIVWVDTAVGGMSGANKSQVLRTRLAAGDPPDAMQFSAGSDVIVWSQQGVLRDLSEVAAEGNWDEVFPPSLAPLLKPQGTWAIVPINMHRQNWLWANKSLFDQVEAEAPANWEELIATGQKLKDNGILPIAISDESWQIGIVFDAILADLHGPEFYKKVAVELDGDALRSDEMLAVFDMLRKVQELSGDNYAGRDWPMATHMVINGQAAMQFMGDWAKGEFLAKGLAPDTDFYCIGNLGSEVSFQYVVDAFGVFVDGKNAEAEIELAKTVAEPEVQKQFNLIKGSIPARVDIDMDEFDACAKKGFDERNTALENGGFVGALTHSFASGAEFANVFTDVASNFFVSSMTSAEARDMLVQGIDNVR